jgi:hypothetical protein
VFVASSHGLIVVAITVVGVYAAILAGVYRLLLQRHVGIPAKALLSELRPAVAGAAGLIPVGFAVRHGLELAGAPELIVLVFAGGAGVLVYAVVLKLAFPGAWADLWMLAVRVVPALDRLPRPGRGRRAAARTVPTAPGSLLP